MNADKVMFTGNKREDKIYYWHTGHPGRHQGARRTGEILDGRFPERVLEKAVERMLPKGPLAAQQMTHLRIYNGAEHPHAAQNPETIAFAEMNRKNSRIG